MRFYVHNVDSLPGPAAAPCRTLIARCDSEGFLVLALPLQKSSDPTVQPCWVRSVTAETRVPMYYYPIADRDRRRYQCVVAGMRLAEAALRGAYSPKQELNIFIHVPDAPEDEPADSVLGIWLGLTGR